MCDSWADEHAEEEDADRRAWLESRDLDARVDRMREERMWGDV